MKEGLDKLIQGYIIEPFEIIRILQLLELFGMKK